MEEQKKRPLVVNFYAGPGAGKSTCALEVTSMLKKHGIIAEYVPEYAKDLVWAERWDELKNQVHVTDTQYERLNVLRDKVDIAVTDSPIMLGIVYGGDKITEEYRNKIREYNDSFATFNLFVKRGDDYQQEGRLETFEEAKQKDDEIRQLLKDNKIFFSEYDRGNMEIVVKNIQTTLSRLRELENKPAKSEWLSRVIQADEIVGESGNSYRVRLKDGEYAGYEFSYPKRFFGEDKGEGRRMTFAESYKFYLSNGQDKKTMTAAEMSGVAVSQPSAQPAAAEQSGKKQQWQYLNIPAEWFVKRLDNGTMFRVPTDLSFGGYIFFHPNKLIKQAEDGSYNLSYYRDFNITLKQGVNERNLSGEELQAVMAGQAVEGQPTHRISAYTASMAIDKLVISWEKSGVPHGNTWNVEVPEARRSDKQWLDKLAERWVEGYNSTKAGNGEYATYYATALCSMEDAGMELDISMLSDEESWQAAVNSIEGRPEKKANDKLYEKNCPLPLRTHKRFICWKREWSEKRQSYIKEPYNPKSGRKADTTDARTWSDFDTACKAVDKYGLDGVGIILGKGLVGIDLDHCIDEKGQVNERAADIISRVNSYTEVSPSGTGIHILAFADMPEGYKKKNEVEMYGAGRFFTLTGNLYQGKFIKMAKKEEAGESVKAVHAQYLGEKPKRVIPAASLSSSPSDMTDAEILKKLESNSKSGASFLSLYRDGNYQRYADKSDSGRHRADLALCGQIAFYTRNAAQIDRIFRGSALMRDKWDEARGSSTYGADTVDLAIQNCTVFYDKDYAKKQAIEAKKAKAASKPSVME